MGATLKKLIYEKNLLYSAAIYLLTPVAVLHLIWRGLRHRPYFSRWRERFGFVKKINAGHVIWVHAVSVGEVRTIVHFIRFLQDEYPGSTVVVTTMTPTGSAQVEQSLGNTVEHCYLPYDLPGSVTRFLDRIHPDLAFIVETEFWPNIFCLCEERDIPTLLVNVRVSPRSFRGYSWFPVFMRTMLQRVTVLAAQSELDAQRVMALGARKGAVSVTGNLKFDIRPPEGAMKRGAELREQWGSSRPVWIAASTHDGEEKKVLKAFHTLKRNHPDTLLVIVPRHPERFSLVARLCRQDGLKMALRSQNNGTLPEGTNVLVGDTMGELAGMYAAADVAFIGGSLIRHGGHNLIEAMSVGVPTIFGPHIFNFEQSSNMALNSGAAKQVRGTEQLAEAVRDYLTDNDGRKRASDAARAVVDDNRGSLEVTKIVVRKALAGTASPPRPAPVIPISGGSVS